MSSAARWRCVLQLGVLAVLMLLAQGPVHAQADTSREAREWFERGLRASRHGEFAEAVTAFERSRSLSERPSVLQNLAVALDHLGRFSEALAALDRAIELGLPRQQRDARRIMDLRAELLAKLAEVTFEVTPETARVELDGKPLSAPFARCDPGPHTVRVSLEGHAPVQRELSLAPGARATERIALHRLDPEVARPALPSPSPGPDASLPAPRELRLKPWALGLLSTGVALAGAGTGVYMLAGRRQDAWDERCTREACSKARLQREQGQIERLDRTSYALFGLASASALCATVLFVRHGRERKKPLSVAVGARSVQLSLRF